jgi:Leucine-rich repeat (LRR) protein
MLRLLRPRITLRVLLLFVALIACTLGWQLKQQREARRAIESLQAKGAIVLRDTETPNNPAPIRQPSWFREFTGDSDLDNIDCIALTNPAVTDQEARLLRHLPSIRRLSISGSSITDEGLKEIAGLPSLEWLDVSGTPVTAVGLLQLEACSTLRELQISENQFRFSPPLGPAMGNVSVAVRNSWR